MNADLDGGYHFIFFSSQTPLCSMAQNVVLETSMGQIVVELYTEHAPKTCQNFSTLASRNYYNGTIFHRIIPDFMIQGQFLQICACNAWLT